MRAKKSLFTIVGFLLFNLLLQSCAPDDAGLDDSKVTETLLDVTSTRSKSRANAAESFWLKGGEVVSCFNARVDSMYYYEREILRGTDCVVRSFDHWLITNATIVALNNGNGQRPQSIWQIDNNLIICDHGKTFLKSGLGEIEYCEKSNWRREGSRLVALNSGSSINAQSFWVKSDGTYLVCDHDKEGVLTRSFGVMSGCSSMSMPTQLTQYGSGFELVAVTSDSDHPYHTFWQGNGVVILCLHEYEGDILSAWEIGASYKCKPWRAPVW